MQEYDKVVYCHPAYLTYMQSTSWEMLGWMNHKLESRLLEEYQQPRICIWYHSNGRKWRGTIEPLDEGERWEWKSWPKIQHSKNEDHGIWFHHFMANKKVKSGSNNILFSLVPKSLQMVTLASWKNNYDKPRQSIKKQSYPFASKGSYSQSYDFCSSHVQMWELHP